MNEIEALKSKLCHDYIIATNNGNDVLAKEILEKLKKIAEQDLLRNASDNDNKDVKTSGDRVKIAVRSHAFYDAEEVWIDYNGQNTKVGGHYQQKGMVGMAYDVQFLALNILLAVGYKHDMDPCRLKEEDQENTYFLIK